MRKLLLILFSILLYAGVCFAGPVVDINNPGGISGLDTMSVGSLLSTQGTKSPFYIPDVAAGRPLLSGGANAQPGYAPWALLGTNGASYNLEQIGSGITFSNNLNINPDKEEIAGVQYQSIANALAYIATQTPAPSATNRWGLLVSGTLGENIDLGNMAYIHIRGIGSASLTGTIINSSATITNYEQIYGVMASSAWAIYNCNINNFSPSHASINSMTVFYNCRISGGTINNSCVFVYGGTITGGNFNTGIFFILNTYVTGGTFGNENGGFILSVYNSLVANGGTFYKPLVYGTTFTGWGSLPELYGGEYYRCSLSSDMLKFANNIRYTLDSCTGVGGFEMNRNGARGVNVSLRNMSYGNIHIGEGNELKTAGGYRGDLYVYEGGGNWIKEYEEVNIAGGTIDNTDIGKIGAAEGHFSTLTASKMITPNKTPLNAVAAAATLTASGIPANGDTVIIDTVTYTFKTTLTPIEGEVLIGATLTDTLTNLRTAINLETNSGAYYCTSAHPTVAATTGTGTLVSTAKTRGASGNSIAVSETSSNLDWGSGVTTLLGGIDGTVGVAGETYRDSSYLYNCIADNTVSDANWRRVSLGTAY